MNDARCVERSISRCTQSMSTHNVIIIISMIIPCCISRSMVTEIEIMKRVRHRYVVSLYELYESPNCLWIVLELVTGGDLRSHLASQATYTEAHASKHMKEILEGLHYLHNRGVVHRDLKLDNILLTEGGDIKIADFGLSALVDDSDYDFNDSGVSGLRRIGCVDTNDSCKRAVHKEGCAETVNSIFQHLMEVEIDVVGIFLDMSKCSRCNLKYSNPVTLLITCKLFFFHTHFEHLNCAGKRKAFNKLNERWGTPSCYAPELIRVSGGDSTSLHPPQQPQALSLSMCMSILFPAKIYYSFKLIF